MVSMAICHCAASSARCCFSFWRVKRRRVKNFWRVWVSSFGALTGKGDSVQLADSRILTKAEHITVRRSRITTWHSGTQD